MIIDDSKFPIVFVDFQHFHNHAENEEHNHDDDLAIFTNLFERGKSFVMISTGETPEENHKHSREETKQVNAWRKIHKEKLKYTKATIQVEQSKIKRIGLRLFASVYEKFWGNPLLLADTEEKAIEMAEKILKEVAAGSSTYEIK